jgi:hypothetical protein
MCPSLPELASVYPHVSPVHVPAVDPPSCHSANGTVAYIRLPANPRAKGLSVSGNVSRSSGPTPVLGGAPWRGIVPTALCWRHS